MFPCDSFIVLSRPAFKYLQTNYNRRLGSVRVGEIERPNARDQIAFYACDCHSFLVKSIRMQATYLPLMRNSKLESWIAGSSGRPQLAYTSYKVKLLLISLWFSVTPLRKVYNSPINFTCPSGKQRTKFPSQTARSTSLGQV